MPKGQLLSCAGCLMLPTNLWTCCTWLIELGISAATELMWYGRTVILNTQETHSPNATLPSCCLHTLSTIMLRLCHRHYAVAAPAGIGRRHQHRARLQVWCGPAACSAGACRPSSHQSAARPPGGSIAWHITSGSTCIVGGSQFGLLWRLPLLPLSYIVTSRSRRWDGVHV